MKQDLRKQLESIMADESTDENRLLLQLKVLLNKNNMLGADAKESKSISSLVSEALVRTEQGIANENIIATGFNDFDAQFGGFSLGEFVILAGRPSMGKTQLMINLAIHFSEKLPVLFFTYDLSLGLLGSRFAASLASLSIDKVLSGKLIEEEKTKLREAEAKACFLKLKINDSCNNSISAFKSLCEKEIEESGAKVIFVDYIQLFTSRSFYKNRETEIGDISRVLKNLARNHNVCIIAGSQMNRSSLDARSKRAYPQLSDLRGSGALEEDADKVIFIHQPEFISVEMDEEGHYTKGITHLTLAKNNSGMLGSIDLLRDLKYNNFMENKERPPEEFTWDERRMSDLDSDFI